MIGVLAGVWWFVRPPPDKEWQVIGMYFGTCGERGRPHACVTDGDTVTLGYGSSARRIRLKGFDAPEIAGECPAESAKAAEAQEALLKWLNAGRFEWSGGREPPRDIYGRELREARRAVSDGKHDRLADHMIGAGLASGDGFLEYRDWCA